VTHSISAAAFIAAASLVTAAWGPQMPAGESGLAVVTHVTDGDTLRARFRSGREVICRLANIDTPERGQPYGAAAKDALYSMVGHQQVTIEDRGSDTRWHRRICIVITGAGVNANRPMAALGLARVYTRYNTDPYLPAIEADAKVARRGLWSAPGQEAPWERRKSH